MSAPAVHYPGNAIALNVADGAVITAGDAVKVVSAKTVDVGSAATLAFVGIAQHDVPLDAPNRVVTLHRVGTQTVTADSAGITAGSKVVCGADGTVRNYVPVAVAGAELEAEEDGDVVVTGDGLTGDSPAAVIGVALTTATDGDTAVIALS